MNSFSEYDLYYSELLLKEDRAKKKRGSFLENTEEQQSVWIKRLHFFVACNGR